MIAKGILVIFTLLLTLPPGVEVSILSKGLTGDFSFPENIVIRNKDELKKVWSEFGITEDVPSVDFNKELVIVLVSRGKLSGSLEIAGVEKRADDLVEVRFVVRPPTSGLKRQKSQAFPYLAAKLRPLEIKKVKVRFVEDIPMPPVPKDTAIGQSPPYTNVLKEYEDGVVSQFLPLDRGNSWTYKIEKDEGKEETYSVISISQDGWSVFDDFFGQKDIAMRVDSSGNIFVSSEKGVQTFYTQDTKKDFSKSELLTPAGKFNDLMIVTLPENDTFWFKDVYAKGVGLIYHEHRSPKGTVKYTLIKAKVKGKTYPSSG